METIESDPVIWAPESGVPPGEVQEFLTLDAAKKSTKI